MSDAFDTADFYTCSDPDVLDKESPEEAIEEFFDDRGSPYSENPVTALLADIARYSPVTVVAYKSASMQPLLRSLALDLAEHAKELLADQDEVPDLDGDVPGFSKVAKAELADRFERVLREIVEAHDIHPWHCEKVAERVYSAAEVEAILRAECPEWFEEEGPAIAGAEP